MPFVIQLPAASSGTVEVVVHEIPPSLAEPERCERWIELVHASYIARNPERADRDWDWRIAIPFVTFGAGARRRPRMFQLCLAEDDFPIAMAALLENECRIGDLRLAAVYLWYMTGAPPEAVARRGAPRLITSAALDIAITVSLGSAGRGHLWLHAAPEGGGRLMDWYEKKGLECVPLGARLPGPIGGRANDGRYFRLNPASASIVSGAMNRYRV